MLHFFQGMSLENVAFVHLYICVMIMFDSRVWNGIAAVCFFGLALCILCVCVYVCVCVWHCRCVVTCLWYCLYILSQLLTHRRFHACLYVCMQSCFLHVCKHTRIVSSLKTRHTETASFLWHLTYCARALFFIKKNVVIQSLYRPDTGSCLLWKKL